jgi:hypothetical protein
MVESMLTSVGKENRRRGKDGLFVGGWGRANVVRGKKIKRRDAEGAEKNEERGVADLKFGHYI